MRAAALTTLCFLSALAASAGTAHAQSPAQSLAQRIVASPDGTVEIRYAVRPGVCGDGVQSFSVGGTTHVGESTMMRGAYTQHGPCLPGPVRARLRVEGGVVRGVRVSVGPSRTGGPARPVRDLGTVPATTAADYFLQLAASGAGRESQGAVVAAVLADSASVWRRLLAIARDAESPSRQTRREALFWLGNFAAAKLEGRGEDITSSDDESDGDDPRSAAVFALSQLRHREGIDPLVQVVRTTREPHLRRKALFWLADSGDPRAVALFSELLER